MLFRQSAFRAIDLLRHNQGSGAIFAKLADITDKAEYRDRVHDSGQ